MNPDLERLHPYPFERLRRLFATAIPDARHTPISLSIGEPKHPTPLFIREALIAALDGLANYPATLGSEALRNAMADWLARRYGITRPDPSQDVIPVTGSREALFAIAQAVIDRTRARPLVVCPNPFYQIYEGAALLAGAETIFANIDPQKNYATDYSGISDEQWSRVQLVYVCSPGNPTGTVMSVTDWRELFALADRFDFVIAADECYSEIYCGHAPPLGALEAAVQLGRSDYARLITFTSLSKRSNVPGMRSGLVAGERALLKKFLLYRTYHGCGMAPPVQAASAAAWADEAHVIENRRLYREKFERVTPLIQAVLATSLPDASFYLWVKTPIDDERFAQQLHAHYNVAVLPGSYLARELDGVNPGARHVRVALVAPLAECLEGARRIVEFTKSL
jgi:N-succinyldiaminopimelate aminotransferase